MLLNYVRQPTKKVVFAMSGMAWQACDRQLILGWVCPQLFLPRRVLIRSLEDTAPGAGLETTLRRAGERALFRTNTLEALSFLRQWRVGRLL